MIERVQNSHIKHWFTPQVGETVDAEAFALSDGKPNSLTYMVRNILIRDVIIRSLIIAIQFVYKIAIDTQQFTNEKKRKRLKT